MHESRVHRRKMDLGYLKRLADHELAVRLEELEATRIRRKVQLDHELTQLRQTIWHMHMMLAKSLLKTWSGEADKTAAGTTITTTTAAARAGRATKTTQQDAPRTLTQNGDAPLTQGEDAAQTLLTQGGGDAAQTLTQDGNGAVAAAVRTDTTDGEMTRGCEQDQLRPRAARRRKPSSLEDPPVWHIPRPKYVDISKDQKNRHQNNEKSFVLLVQKYRELRSRRSTDDRLPVPAATTAADTCSPAAKNEPKTPNKSNPILVIPGLTRSKTYTWGTIPSTKQEVVRSEDWTASSVAIARRRTVDFSRVSPLEPIAANSAEKTEIAAAASDAASDAAVETRSRDSDECVIEAISVVQELPVEESQSNDCIPHDIRVDAQLPVEILSVAQC